MTAHTAYPHTPGTLYDCGACESRCYCDALRRQSECIYCSLVAESEALMADPVVMAAIEEAETEKYGVTPITYRTTGREITYYVPSID